jgi:quercetin dioxygenase-like cupin family protein
VTGKFARSLPDVVPGETGRHRLNKQTQNDTTMTMLQSDNLQAGQLDMFSYRNPHTRDVQLVRLFRRRGDARLSAGRAARRSQIERHTHENKHELFDVLEGEGCIEVDGRPWRAGRGAASLCPRAVSHSLHNTGDAPWTLRITCQDRVYPRHLGKLIGRALRKRLPWG